MEENSSFCLRFPLGEPGRLCRPPSIIRDLNAPSISVLMAVRDGGPFLEKAMNSMAAQTFGDWEMIVIDDASTDDSVAVARNFALRDARINVIENSTNKGQTACLNEGLAACRGKWVARQDADDLSHPERLAEQMSYLRSNPRTVLLGTQGVLIDGRGRRIGLLDVPAGRDEIAWCSPFLNPFIHTAMIFDREVVSRAGAYDENYQIAQDYELWTRIAAEHAVANLSSRLVSYRYSKGSLSSAGRERALTEADLVSEREAVRWLGRPWTRNEKSLASDFRRGLHEDKRGAFWSMIKEIEGEKNISRLPARLRAAWHLKLAGAGDGICSSDIFSAFRVAPFFTAGWLLQRIPLATRGASAVA